MCCIGLPERNGGCPYKTSTMLCGKGLEIWGKLSTLILCKNCQYEEKIEKRCQRLSWTAPSQLVSFCTLMVVWG